MNRRLLWASIFRPLSRYRLRSFLMSLGIVIGVAVLVVTRSLGSGAEKKTLASLEKMFGAASFMVSAGGSGMEVHRSGPVTTLEIADVRALAEEIDGIVAWDPIQRLGGRDVKAEGTSRQLTIHGVSEQAEVVWNRGVLSGDFITEGDVRSAARVALIGTKAAAALFGDDDPVGRRIQVGTATFEIKGVLEPYGFDPHGDDRDDEIQVPITTLLRRLRNADYLMAAKFIVEDPAVVEEAAAQVGEILRRRHAIAEGEPGDFSVFTPVQVRRMVARANRVLKVFLPAAAGLALLVAAIIIADLMLMSLGERVPEIGLRKAVGATDGQVGVQFLAEVLLMTVISGALGVAIGVTVVAFIATHLRSVPILSADAIALGLLAAVSVGLLAGFLPARRASRLDPIEALR